MTLEEFESLAPHRQLDLLYRDGVFIGKARKLGTISILMQLDAFYVEIFYLRYRSLVKQMNAFASPSGIDEYLQPILIDIENLAR